MNGFVPPACTLHSRPVAGSVRPGVARSVGTSLSVRVTDPGPRACRSAAASQAAKLWVLRSTLKDEATDTTLAPGEGISSDHTFLLRHQQRAIVIHVPLSYQLSPLDVGSLDLSPGRTGTVESLSVATTG